MTPPRSALRHCLWALVICAVASGLGLAANALRPDGLPLVAPFPYAEDCPDRVPLDAPQVTLAQARVLCSSGAALLLDARPAEAYAERHLDGARSLPYSFVSPPTAATLAELRKLPRLIAYCDSPGDRLAQMLAAQLRELGAPSVHVLQAGAAALEGSRR